MLALRDGDQVAGQERQHRERRQDLHPKRGIRPQTVGQEPHHQSKRSQLGRRGDQQHHARRGAVIDVGHPHVERHRTKLERHGHHDKGHGDHESRAVRGVDGGDLVEAQATGQPVEHRHAIEQCTRGDGAQHKVLYGRLGSHARVAIEGHQGIERQRQQFQAQVHGKQAVGGHQHADAQQRGQGEDLIFTAGYSAAVQIGLRIEQRQADGEERRQLEEHAKVIGDVQAVKQHGAHRHRA